MAASSSRVSSETTAYIGWRKIRQQERKFRIEDIVSAEVTVVNATKENMSPKKLSFGRIELCRNDRTEEAAMIVRKADLAI